MNEERLMASIEDLATKCNETPEHGVTRISWTKMDLKAHLWLEKEFSRIGVPVWTDGAGNVHALYRGKTKEPRLIIGSHLDTVRNGGKYDGTYGMLAALEVLRSFKEERFQPDRNIEFIAFAEEEGSNFGTTCLGSKLITGVVSPEKLKDLKNEETNAWEMLEEFGMHPENLVNEQINAQDVFAFLEVHVEQGKLLEQKKYAIGIVTAISGMLLHRVVFKGHSAHAASKMEGRRDPLVCFVECHQALQKAYQDNVLPEGSSFTVGKIACYPGIGNVVPNECAFCFDVRHYEVPLLAKSWEICEKIIRDTAQKNNIEVEITPLSASGGVKMAEIAQNAFKEAAQNLGYEFMELPSGPAHDAAAMANVVPAGLLFVPSKDGISHSPDEYTAPEDLAKGARVYEEAIRKLATITEN